MGFIGQVEKLTYPPPSRKNGEPTNKPLVPVASVINPLKYPLLHFHGQDIDCGLGVKKF